jgi:hypothetical protein
MTTHRASGPTAKPVRSPKSPSDGSIYHRRRLAVAGLRVHGCNDALRRRNEHILDISLVREPCALPVGAFVLRVWHEPQRT